MTVQLNDSDPLDSDSYSVNSTTNILTLTFSGELIVGETYLLKIDFEGTLYTSSGSKFAFNFFLHFALFFTNFQMVCTGLRTRIPIMSSSIYWLLSSKVLMPDMLSLVLTSLDTSPRLHTA